MRLHSFSRRRIAILLLAQLFGPGAAASTAPLETATAGSALFSDHAVLDLTLVADFDAMCRPNEVEDCQYTPTTLRYTAAGGGEISLAVEIRVRGGWRARKDHCDIPPLFVRFSAEDTQGTPFAGQELLPLTTSCQSRRHRGLERASGKDYEQYVLKEYLGYRLYNLLSERSLRVRLARISYAKPASPDQPEPRFAFFTEHFDQMAARNMAKRLPRKSFDHQEIDLAAFDRVSLFNFMIGNTDFSVVRQRNIVLIAAADGRQYPVPFDLDMSGLVDAEYGGVSPRLDFRDPRKRYYLGFCHPQPDFENLFAEFQRNKEQVLSLPETISGISNSTRKKSRSYLKKFFAILQSPKKSQKAIIGACHPWPPAPQDHTTPPDKT